MKSNKLIFTSILILTLCISVLVAFTGCKDDTVTDLYIKNSDQPRLTYVEGQDLDLTGGEGIGDRVRFGNQPGHRPRKGGAEDENDSQ